MDSYIIRIYRRPGQDKQDMYGIVEDVNAGDQQAFRDRDELWEILSSQAEKLTHHRLDNLR